MHAVGAGVERDKAFGQEAAAGVLKRNNCESGSWLFGRLNEDGKEREAHPAWERRRAAGLPGRRGGQETALHISREMFKAVCLTCT